MPLNIQGDTNQGYLQINGSTAVTVTSTGITTASIQDSAITTAKINDGAVTTAKLAQPLTLATSVASTSGTAIDFTGIPSWVKRITVMLNGVSTNGSSRQLVRIGTSSGIEATGYTAGGTFLPSGTGAGYGSETVGFVIQAANAAATNSGIITICNLSSNTWVFSCVCANTGESGSTVGGGVKTLSGTLDRVRITTVNGTDTFDAGSVNIMYEG